MGLLAWLFEHWLTVAIVLGAFACAYAGYLVEKDKQCQVDRTK